MNTTYKLNAISLLHKYGFQDGDIFENILEEKNGYGLKEKLLHKAVEKYLLPIIPYTVKLYVKSSLHNPVRAIEIDGVEITEDNYQGFEELLGDDFVEITREQIVELITIVKLEE